MATITEQQRESFKANNGEPLRLADPDTNRQ
jgi:hypothetical protein